MRHENYANCASGTAHNDGDNILEAVRAQQRERLNQHDPCIGLPMTRELKDSKIDERKPRWKR